MLIVSIIYTLKSAQSILIIMTKEEAQNQLAEFFSGCSALTFSIIECPENKWVAQCNEVDSIITGGEGYDLAEMESLMEDAILTAAGIPRDIAANNLKRVWATKGEARPVDGNAASTLFQSSYQLSDFYNVGMGHA